MRCPSCGARNADSAEWCTQCYAALPGRSGPAAPDDAGPRPVTADAAAPDLATPESARQDAAGPDTAAGPVTSADPRFRRTDEGLDWRCDTCGTWNPIERRTCTSCGQPFEATIAPEAPPTDRDVDPTVAVVASLVLPGAGHLLLGRVGQGVVRAGLYVLWLGGGILLLHAAAASDQGLLPAVPLLLGALVLLFASVAEVQQTTAGHDLTVLGPRVILWLVVGVLGLLMLSFFAAIGAAV